MFLRTLGTESRTPESERRLMMADSTGATAAAEALDLKEFSERYFAAWAARDPDAIVALHTEDTEFWAHAGGEPVKGREAVREEFAQVFERFPEYSFETYRVLYGPDFWVLDWALIFRPDGAEETRRFDCLDVVNVSPDGLVARKDTFFDYIQLQAAMPEISGEATERVEAERSREVA
jgi:uncharacterized protein (TIGR02246 family)